MAPPTIELIMVRQSEQMPWCGEYLANIRRSVILPVFQNYQALIICWNPNSYLTGVVSSKLLWYIFNMNIIKMEKMVILETQYITEKLDDGTLVTTTPRRVQAK